MNLLDPSVAGTKDSSAAYAPVTPPISTSHTLTQRKDEREEEYVARPRTMSFSLVYFQKEKGGGKMEPDSGGQSTATPQDSVTPQDPDPGGETESRSESRGLSMGIMPYSPRWRVSWDSGPNKIREKASAEEDINTWRKGSTEDMGVHVHSLSMMAPKERKDYDPQYKGPILHRRCTDVHCLLVFTAFLVGLLIVASLALTIGNPETFAHPVDSEGNVCGVGERKTRPLLFTSDLVACSRMGIGIFVVGCPTPRVCVSACPSHDWIAPVNSTSGSEAGAICTEDGGCAAYYLSSYSVMDHCLPRPRGLADNETVLISGQTVRDASNQVVTGAHVHYAREAFKAYLHGQVVSHRYMRSLDSVVGSLVVFGVLVMVYSLLWVVAIRVSIKSIWVAVFVFLLNLSVVVFICYFQFIKFQGSGVTLPYSSVKKSNAYLAAAICFNVFLAVCVAMVISLRERIKRTMVIVWECSRAIVSMPSTLLGPVASFALQLCVILMWLALALHIATIPQRWNVDWSSGKLNPSDMAEKGQQGADMFETQNCDELYGGGYSKDDEREHGGGGGGGGGEEGGKEGEKAGYVTTELPESVTSPANSLATLKHVSATLSRRSANLKNLIHPPKHTHINPSRQPQLNVVDADLILRDVNSLPLDRLELNTDEPQPTLSNWVNLGRKRRSVPTHELGIKSALSRRPRSVTHSSSPHVEHSQICGQINESHAGRWAVVMQLYLLFVVCWLLSFIRGLQKMSLAGAYAEYYWAYDKMDVPTCSIRFAATRALRYHAGSIALGSVMVGAFSSVRIKLLKVREQLKDTKATHCCVLCLENYLKYIIKKSFMMIAVHGLPYLSSCQQSSLLIKRYANFVIVPDNMMLFLVLMFVSMVATTAGLAAYLFYITDFVDKSHTTPYMMVCPWVPIVFVIIVAIVIAQIFFDVYSVAVDTMFMCLLNDLDIHDGTAVKPYFMTIGLMKVFIKHEKGEDYRDAAMRVVKTPDPRAESTLGDTTV